MKQLIIIGGGASGFFLAANFRSALWRVVLLEQSSTGMKKLKLTGGGRCNLTNACFSPSDLAKNYPRGGKKLKQVFSKFQAANTIEWFESRGVALKTEKDNRVFPVSDSSFSVTDLLLRKAKENNTDLHYDVLVENISQENGRFLVKTNKKNYQADALVLATGSSPKIWGILNTMGHTIVPPVPSLFTFKCKSPLIADLQGISFSRAELSLPSSKLKQSAPLLITHQGLSGPAVLRLSAWAARYLSELQYRFTLKVNWLSLPFEELREILSELKAQQAKKMLFSLKLYDLTQRFWIRILDFLAIPNKLVGELSKSDINRIAEILTNTTLPIQGKNVFKEEFVTAGGVDLTEVDFSSMQSKKINNLFFSGELLDIDGLTGGFNLQACWSEAFVISEFLKKDDSL